jgi:hypothetical protein
MVVFGLAALTYFGFEMTWWAPFALLAVSLAGTALQMRYGSPLDRALNRWFPPRSQLGGDTSASR